VLILTLVVLLATRKATRWLRDTLRILWVGVLVGAGVGLVMFAARMVRLNPDVNPTYPGLTKLGAIGEFAEAFFVAAVVWLPYLFDALERSTSPLLLAVRQLRARKSGFLTVISFLAFFGVGLASFGLCLTISVMGGFGNDLKRKILGNNAHVVIDRERDGFSNWRPLVDRIRRVPGVTSVTPLVQGEVMITSQTNLSGVILRGVEPDGGGSAANVRRELICGRMQYLIHPERLLTLGVNERCRPTSREPSDSSGGGPAARRVPPQRGGTPAPDGSTSESVPGGRELLLPPVPSLAGDILPGVIVGRELATNLHLQLGDEVRVVSPFGGMITPAGPLPKTRLFRVAGIFYSGMYEYDTKYAYLTIPVAQDFFNYRRDQISSIEVRVGDVDRADRIANEIRPLVASEHLRVRDWQQLNRNLFRALKLEKLMMFVLLGVAILVASFAIVATLLLFVMEKGREIAVIKAMGASDAFIARVFVWIGMIIGGVGSLLGVGCAFLVCSLIQRLGIPIDPEVYYIERLPVFISATDYVMVMLLSVGVCLVATLIPAWVASRLRPVDGMRQ